MRRGCQSPEHSPGGGGSGRSPRLTSWLCAVARTPRFKDFVARELPSGQVAGTAKGACRGYPSGGLRRVGSFGERWLAASPSSRRAPPHLQRYARPCPPLFRPPFALLLPNRCPSLGCPFRNPAPYLAESGDETLPGKRLPCRRIECSRRHL